MLYGSHPSTGQQKYLQADLRWCPSIAWMKRRQRKAGRLLIASVDDSLISLGKRKGVEPTGSYGTKMPAQSRSTSTFWPGCHREFPSTKARLAMVYFSFAAPTSDDAFPVVLKTYLSPWWTTAEEQRVGLCNGPDARHSCICCHPRYRGTPPSRAGAMFLSRAADVFEPLHLALCPMAKSHVFDELA